MPYFRCDRCAVRLYSAAASTHCSVCGASLAKAEPLAGLTPLPRPMRGRYPTTMRSLAGDRRSPR